MRARRPRTQPLSDVPVFIRKTYQMINSCPEEICIWSESGNSFLVKNPKEFAGQIIPQYFNHSNFSSFVRQLNYWGFHKIKSNDLIASGKSLIWWEFKHELFLKDRPDLLPQMKRNQPTSSGSHHTVKGGQIHTMSSSKEVRELRSQVLELQRRVEELTSQLKTKEEEDVEDLEEELAAGKVNKKRRTRSGSVGSVASSCSSLSTGGLMEVRMMRELETWNEEEEDDPFLNQLKNLDLGVPNYESQSLYLSPTEFSQYVEALPLPLQDLFLEKLAASVGSQMDLHPSSSLSSLLPSLYPSPFPPLVDPVA